MAKAATEKRGGFRRPFVAPKLDAETIEGLPEGPDSEILGFLEHVRLEPRKGEAELLAKIESAADAVVENLFAAADQAMAALRDAVRVPLMADYGHSQMVMRDDTGHIVYQQGEDGKPVLDWRRVDGMDIEVAIISLQEVLDRAVDEVARLHSRAAMAYQVKEDEYWDAYRHSFGSVINDNVAAAQWKSRDARYYFFAMWSIWDRADKKLEAVKQAKKDLEWTRQRLVREADAPRER